MRFPSVETLQQSLGADLQFHPVFANDVAHVWGVDLEVHQDCAQRLESKLSTAEIERAASFRFPKDRHHFVVRRAALRIMLGQYLGVIPEDLSFAHNLYGKPAISGQTERDGLKFSVSLSADLALIAVGCGREVGVDVERLESSFDPLFVGKICFSSRELDTIRALPPAARMEAFLRGWTRKEAYLKAKGLGLNLPLHNLEVSLSSTAALIEVCGDPEEPTRWSIYELNTRPGYIGSLAVEITKD